MTLQEEGVSMLLLARFRAKGAICTEMHFVSTLQSNVHLLA